MAFDDMNHMQHIEGVALSDCAVLTSKEATYQGSWKRAGGRSAWFMARRNMDRLLTMMAAKPVPPMINLANVLDTLQGFDNIVHYNQNPLSSRALPGSIEATRAIIAHLKDAYTADDIFGRIAQRPKGEDGTVLACMRDLRRYLLLVEAEMIAEGVVENESKTYEQEHYPVDVYQMIADEKGLDRDEVKRRVHELFYGSPALPDPGPAIGGAFEMPDTPSCGDGLFDTHQQRRAERIADGGSHHASLVPWWIGVGYHDTLVNRAGQPVIDKFYTRRTPDTWCLEPVVESQWCAREIAPYYTHVLTDGVSLWILKRGEVPEMLDDQFPRLQIEMNRFEWETSEEAYRFMYAPNDNGEKMILKPEYAAWGREA